MVICRWCKQKLIYTEDRGWVHREGGRYHMVCKKCGWEGAPFPSPVVCPRCGSDALYDHHYAFPIYVKSLKEVAP